MKLNREESYYPVDNEANTTPLGTRAKRQPTGGLVEAENTMRIAILTLAAALGLAAATPAFADSMDRDGGPSGALGAPYQTYNQSWRQEQRPVFYTGRSVAHDRQVVVRGNDD
jgi:hypothetical protein